MTTEKTALELAKSWFRAATPPGSTVDVTVAASSGGWLARAVVNPRPARPLPMLRITETGVVQIVGGPFFGPMAGPGR
jgi:hypothetical protein